MNKQGESNRIFGVNLCDVMARPTQKVVPTVVKEMFLTLQKNGNIFVGTITTNVILIIFYRFNV